MAGIKRRTTGKGSAKFTPKNAKNVVAVAKVIGPAVVPVVAPFAAKGASLVRDYVDRRKARKLGVPIGDIAKYSGKGGGLHARITGLAEVLAELTDRETDEFTRETDVKLRQLSAAVRTAERMPAPRRKAAHRAVSGELDQIEARLLHKLGL